MNLGQLRQAFRRDDDDRTEPYLWPDEDVNAWLNEAQREACIRARMLICKERLWVTTGDPIVALPQALFEISVAALHLNDRELRTLQQYDALERDRLYPHWRARTRLPYGFVHRDGEIELNALPDRDYELIIEGFRLPEPMLADSDTPEINPIHHERLLHWALFRAYSVPDKEMFDPNRAAEQEARFEYYFGRRPKASLRKAQSANNPHHNKCWW